MIEGAFSFCELENSFTYLSQMIIFPYLLYTRSF